MAGTTLLTSRHPHSPSLSAAELSDSDVLRRSATDRDRTLSLQSPAASLLAWSRVCREPAPAEHPPYPGERGRAHPAA